MIHNSIIPGDGGVVLTNPPTWKKGNLPTTFDVSFSLVYGAGKFVALNYGSNKAAYSTDGINWTEVTLPVSATWCSVCYGGGKFVGIPRTGSSLVYSTDGITWTKVTLPTWLNYTWDHVRYSGGMFILTAAMYNNKYTAVYLYSTDAITWTKGLISADGEINGYVENWGALTYGMGKFVILGKNANSYSSDNREPAYYSTDGIKWTLGYSSVHANWNSACYGRGTFVAVGEGGTSDRNNATTVAMYSADGITWTQTTMPAKIQWRDVCYGAGMFVAVGYMNEDGTNPNCMAYSVDGITWKLVNGTGNIRRESVFFGGGKFVVCTENAGNEYLEPTYKELA